MREHDGEAKNVEREKSPAEHQVRHREDKIAGSKVAHRYSNR